MFDIGVNLTSSQFSRDHDEVVARALAAGVNGMLLTGTNLAESQQAQKLASRYSGCWSTAGVHPHDGSSWTPAVAEAIYTLAGEPQVVAIGECGLDFNRNFSTPQEQEEAFSAQLALAAELSMPVFGLELASWIEARLGRKPLWCGDTGPDTVSRVAWCTGGGQSFIDAAARFGVDAFITGEVSEQTIHSAREQGLHFYAAGHHATERGGIRALSEWLTETTDLDVTFIDIPNPA